MIASGRRLVLPLAVLVVGVAARCAVSRLGYNYDLLSYTVVASLVEDGRNVYAATTRYNYAPPWSYVLHALAVVASRFDEPLAAFRWALTLLLTATDVAIAAWLLERFGQRAAILFFLNPVSVFITGYHRQFDNIAVLVGLVAASAFGGRGERGRPVAGSALLGASLAIKHLLFVFPLWLAVKERSARDRLVVLLLPPALLAATFLPFLPTGAAGIVNNVLLYRGYGNASLWHLLLPDRLLALVSPTGLFVAALAALGVLLRRHDPVTSLLAYLPALVAFSPSVANQALVLPAATMAVSPNPLFGAYVAVVSLHLLVHHEGLHLAAVERLVPGAVVGYPVQVAILLAALLWMLGGRRIADLAARRLGRGAAGRAASDSHGT
jgi:hypothetical protein